MSRYILYFFLSAIPPVIAAQTMPSSPWEWTRFVASTLYAGLIAIKALQSPQPPPAP